MWTDIIELREFYGSPRGATAAAILRKVLARYIPTAGVTAAFGYAPPVLPATARNAILLMPPGQGVAAWPRDGANQSVLCEEESWPLPDQSLDTVILMHALENCANPAALITEAWRVLKGNGQLVLVAANRRGLWSRVESTPFGRGRPYTATQLRRLLHAEQFVPEKWERALYIPPFKNTHLLNTAWTWEIFGPTLLPTHGGTIVMRAAKQLYAPTGRTAPTGKRLKLPMPTLLPTPISGPIATPRNQ